MQISEELGRYAIWRNANWWDAIMDDDLRKALAKMAKDK